MFIHTKKKSRRTKTKIGRKIRKLEELVCATTARASTTIKSGFGLNTDSNKSEVEIEMLLVAVASVDIWKCANFPFHVHMYVYANICMVSIFGWIGDHRSRGTTMAHR